MRVIMYNSPSPGGSLPSSRRIDEGYPGLLPKARGFLSQLCPAGQGICRAQKTYGIGTAPLSRLSDARAGWWTQERRTQRSMVHEGW
jgi:hypothetical protein